MHLRLYSSLNDACACMQGFFIKKVKVQIIKLQLLPKHQGRLSAAELGKDSQAGYEIKWVGWTAAHSTWDHKPCKL